GNGLGAVVLKRLDDALRDNDTIHAVIRGSAVNNDGSLKVGYTAPSAEGQATVISNAQLLSGIDPDSIGFVETNGTGTLIGDTLEISALKRVFGAGTSRRCFCAIGSVKTNVGHLHAAAGIASFIKTVLALKHKELPASLNYERPNPNIDFDGSAFYVNSELKKWETNGGPRRAGVSAFGVGGTNAHVILEEWEGEKRGKEEGESGEWELLVISAKSEQALERATENLKEHLKREKEIRLGDVSYTLAVGRKEFRHRRTVMCRSVGEAIEAIESRDEELVKDSEINEGARPVVFMFPGQGSQFQNMGADLYKTKGAFRSEIDECSTLLISELGLDIRELLYPADFPGPGGGLDLLETSIAQPALFAVEYALAKQWMAWGINPESMIGHSVGEFVAACLAGVFSLEAALRLVAVRGRLMQGLSHGAMIAVQVGEHQAHAFLRDGISLAAINGPEQCVLSGRTEDIEKLEAHLSLRGTTCKRLRTSHAFHSAMMEPVLNEFEQELSRVSIGQPRIRYISNLTGSWVTAADVKDVKYWSRHLRQTVRFADGLDELLKSADRIFLEVGPGQGLGRLLKTQRGFGSQAPVVASMKELASDESDERVLTAALAKLWREGVSPLWEKCHDRGHRSRVPLPTYPFERERYWIDPRIVSQPGQHQGYAAGKAPDIATWFYIPSWRRSQNIRRRRQEGADLPPRRWMVFAADSEFSDSLLARLNEARLSLIVVRAGEGYEKARDGEYRINPSEPADYAALIADSSANKGGVTDILHLWSLTSEPDHKADNENFGSLQLSGLFSVLFLAQSLGSQQALDELTPTGPLNLWILSNRCQEIDGN
ncbi:MAG: type I polyketide synthase, partial [Blastocatellia bacterium]